MINSDVTINEPDFKFKSPYLAWIGLSVVYGFLGFVTVMGLEVPNMTCILILFTIIISTIQLTSIWSAFGEGKFLVRILKSSAVGLIVITGIVLGEVVMIGQGSLPKSSLGLFMAFAFTVPALLCGSQLPFWVMRGIWGWQFVQNGSRPAPRFTLRELFALTFVIALSLAALQFSISFYINAFPELYEVDISALSPREAEQQLRQNRANVQSGMLTGQLVYSLMFFVLSLLIMPFVFLVFRMKDSRTGCVMCLVLGSLVTIFVVVLSIVVNGGIGIAGIIGFGGVGLAFSTISVIAPLAYLRSIGYSLTTPKLFEQEAINPVQSATAGSVS